MALPSKFSVGLPVEVVASGGHLVRQVDTSGVALDDATYSYSVAMPVMPVDSNGVNEDSSLVFSTHLKVTISSKGLPVVRIDTAGNTINTALGGGAGSTTPVNTAAPVLSGTPTQAATLSVTNGTWTNSPTGYHYYWTADGATIASAADANTYTLTSAEVGKMIQCLVVAVNGAATSSPAASNSLGPVTNTGGIPANSVAPAITGDAVVGQTLYSGTGTWTNSPTSYTYQWYKDGVALSGETADTLLLNDVYQGGIIKCNVTATNAAGSANQDSGNTAAVVAIDLTNAIISITRTSASGGIPMTADIAFGSNVYAGYFLDRIVYTDSGLTTLKGATTADATARHYLTNDDLQPGATIDWSADGGPSIAATDWVQYVLRTTSPNAVGYMYTYPTAISPTDAVVPMIWSSSNTTTGITLSNNNLQAASTGSPNPGGLSTNHGVSSGKFYVEFIHDGFGAIQLLDSSAVVGTDYQATPSPHAVDFANGSGTLNYNTANYTVGGFSGATFTGSISGTTLTVTLVNAGVLAVGQYIAGPGIPFGTKITADTGGAGGAGTYTIDRSLTVGSTTYLVSAQVVGMAVDVTNNLLWVSINNSWQNAGNPSTNTNGISISGIGNPVFPAALLHNGRVCAINPGDTPGGTTGFIFTPPTGFVAP